MKRVVLLSASKLSLTCVSSFSETWPPYTKHAKVGQIILPSTGIVTCGNMAARMTRPNGGRSGLAGSLSERGGAESKQNVRDNLHEVVGAIRSLSYATAARRRASPIPILLGLEFSCILQGPDSSERINRIYSCSEKKKRQFTLRLFGT
jgi:hypothetical protein